MPQSVARVVLHLVYSTKDRIPWLKDRDLCEEEARRYIANQVERHRGISFEDEFRKLCIRHGITLDERYAWD